MSLVSRTSTVKCDFCGVTATLQHQIEYEADAGYPYNLALDQAGWDEPFNAEHGYRDRCPTCRTKNARTARKE